LTTFVNMLQRTEQLNLASPVHIVNTPVVVQIPHVGWVVGDYLVHSIPQFHMSIHRSPLRHNTYHISIYHSSGNTNVGSFVRYVCTIPETRGTAARGKLISDVPAPHQSGCSGITYSGYVSLCGAHEVYHPLRIPFDRSTQRLTMDPVLHGGGWCLARDVSAYGCVVASVTAGYLHVCFYE
jgi:hypothetical protein